MNLEVCRRGPAADGEGDLVVEEVDDQVQVDRLLPVHVRVADRQLPVGHDIDENRCLSSEDIKLDAMIGSLRFPAQKISSIFVRLPRLAVGSYFFVLENSLSFGHGETYSFPI